MNAIEWMINQPVAMQAARRCARTIRGRKNALLSRDPVFNSQQQFFVSVVELLKRRRAFLFSVEIAAQLGCDVERVTKLCSRHPEIFKSLRVRRKVAFCHVKHFASISNSIEADVLSAKNELEAARRLAESGRPITLSAVRRATSNNQNKASSALDLLCRAGLLRFKYDERQRKVYTLVGPVAG